MKKKFLPVIFAILVGLSLLSGITPYSDPVKADADYDPDIQVWGKQTLVANTHHVRFPSVTVADNGDLVVLYTYMTYPVDYSCENSFYCMISHDNGSTWGTPYEVHHFDFHTESWSLITAPNGDLLFLVTKDQEWDVHNGTDIWRNDNNGAEGSWERSGNFSEYGKIFIYDWITYGNKIYAFANDPNLYAGAEGKILYSDDNGYTWNTMGNEMTGFGTGEWSALPLNANASHWRTISRFTKNGLFTADNPSSCLGIEPHLQAYYPITSDFETTDRGVTWTDLNTNCPEQCGTSTASDNDHNKGNAMFWLDDECIVACVETSSNYASIYVSHDNMTTWGDHVNLGAEGSNFPKNAYTRGCALPKRSGTIGGWGYLVWSEQEDSYIKGCWVANNDSLVWEEPAGALDGEAPPTGQDLYWDDINSDENESITASGLRFYNASSYDAGDVYYYEIQISNNSAFTDIFATIYVNETVFGANFEDDGINWFLADPTTIEGYGGGYGDHYYRYRARYRTVSE